MSAKPTPGEEGVLAALAQALEQQRAWRAEQGLRPPDGVYAADIARLLAPWRPAARASDVGVVVHRLRALERKGLVEHVGKEWETARWRLAPATSA